MQIKRLIATSAAAAALLALPAAAAQAADTYVDDDSGLAANDCSSPVQGEGSAGPCDSVQAGVDAAGSGDTVHIDGGTYGGRTTLGGGRSLTHDEFNFGDGDSTAVLDGGSDYAIFLDGSAAGTISGFTIRGAAIPVYLNSPVTLRNNTFDSAGEALQEDIAIGGGANGTVIDNNTFTTDPNVAPWATGIVVGAAVSITGNHFTSMWTAISASGGGALEIKGNDIAGTHDASVGQSGYGMRILQGTQATISDNNIHGGTVGDYTFGITVVGAAETTTTAVLHRNRISGANIAVQDRDSSAPVTLDGDLITGNFVGISSADYGSGGGDVSLSNVTVWQSAYIDASISDTHLTIDSSIIGTTGIDGFGGCTITYSRGPSETGNSCQTFQSTVAPQFVGDGDFHLTPGSPMIDAGNPAVPAEGSTDFEGDGRQFDGDANCSSVRDIGADERRPAAPAATLSSAPADNSILSQPMQSFEWSSGGPAECTTYECKADGSLAPCTSPQQIPFDDGNNHSFRVRAVDVDGQQGAYDSRTFNMAAPPETTVESVKVKSRKMTAAFSGVDQAPTSGVVTFMCKIDKGAYSTCAAPKSYTLRVGKHTFSVYAVDAAGNPDATPVTKTFRVKKAKKPRKPKKKHHR